MGTIGRPAHGIFLTSGGDALPGCRRRTRDHARPAGKRAQRGTADLRHRRHHPAYSGPGRKPVPHRFLPQAQADRPGHRVRRVRRAARRWPFPRCPCWPTTAPTTGSGCTGNGTTSPAPSSRPSRSGATPATTATVTTPPRPASWRLWASPGTWCRARRISHRRLGHAAPRGLRRAERPGHPGFHRGGAPPAPRSPRTSRWTPPATSPTTARPRRPRWWRSPPRPPTSRDWFDLGIVITLEGQPVSFAALFSALAAGQTRMLLPSGAYFSLDLPELHQLRALIDEARSCRTTRTRRCRSAASRPASGTSLPSWGSWTSRPPPGARRSAACWRAASRACRCPPP